MARRGMLSRKDRQWLTNFVNKIVGSVESKPKPPEKKLWIIIG